MEVQKGGFMTSTKISNIEAIFFILTIMINHIIMNLPKSILNFSGSSSILNIIMILIITLIIVYFITIVMKKFPNQDILDISEYLGGKTLKNIIGILFLIYFLFSASIFLRSFCESLKIIYFRRTPIVFVIIFFITGIIICNRLGFGAIVRSNMIFMPIILFSIIFIFFANISNFDFTKMFPLFGNGIVTTFFSGISNLYAFAGLSLLYFVPPYLKREDDFEKVAFASIILSGIWLIFSIATLLFIFPAIVTTDEMLPLYIASRFIEFGRFFQRLDSIFLLIWIISILSYLSILVSLMTSIFKKLTHFKYHYVNVYLFSILTFICSLIVPNYNQSRFLKTHVYQWIVLILVFIISLALLLFAYLKNKHKKKNVEREVRTVIE